MTHYFSTNGCNTGSAVCFAVVFGPDFELKKFEAILRKSYSTRGITRWCQWIVTVASTHSHVLFLWLAPLICFYPHIKYPCEGCCRRILDMAEVSTGKGMSSFLPSGVVRIFQTFLITAISQSPESKSRRVLFCFAPQLNASNTAVENQEKHPIIELKNGKVNFKQKPMSLEKLSETLQGATN